MVDESSLLRGIVPIPVTSFKSGGDLDVSGMRKQVDFCIDAGAHGLLYPGVVSEFYSLTDAERRQAVEVCVETAAGRVPVVVGVSATNTQDAISFAKHAADLEADAVMAMTPFVEHFFPPTAEDARKHLRAVADAAQVPVILQNARIGHVVPIATLAALVEAVPEIDYVKQETNPQTQGLSDVLSAIGDRIEGVFAGMGGVYLINELERGALGSMPAPPFTDILVKAYDAHQSDGADAAQSILDPFGTLFTRELLYNAIFIKEVLRRRGVIDNTTVRIASPVLDPTDLADLDRMLRTVGLA